MRSNRSLWINRLNRYNKKHYVTKCNYSGQLNNAGVDSTCVFNNCGLEGKTKDMCENATEIG